MANPGDILAPKLLQDGTFEEVVLTPASIGAASLFPSPNAAPAQAAVELRSEEAPAEVALKWSPQADGWFVADSEDFRIKLGAAPAIHPHDIVDVNGLADALATFSSDLATLESRVATTISATGDILGSGTNRLLGFVAGGATY